MNTSVSRNSKSGYFSTLSLLFLTACFASAANLASDNADNYTTWTNGSNQGTGFGAWDLSNNNNNGTTVFAGYFLGDSTAGSGNINSPTKSFGMFANPGSAFADASRGFTGGALSIGQTFSLTLAVNFRNGNKGIDLLSGTTGVFNFNVGGDDYKVNGVSLVANGNSTGAWAYSATSVINLSFTQVNSTQMSVLLTRGSDSYSNTLTLSGVDGFKLYNSGTGDGSNQNNLYANNLAIVPEPSTWLLLGGAALMLISGRGMRSLIL